VACLERNGWKTSAAAAELGISRTSLYALIERSPQRAQGA
jgi:transcriptional regulator of acetoin/glycerol metabolism